MRIWDIDPGYLNRQSLLGEHRELHGLVSIVVNNKKGYSRHPETRRWMSYGWALKYRHRLLSCEMSLRGYFDKTPVHTRSNPNRWPVEYIDEPALQFKLLEEKYKNKEMGRIKLPNNIGQLWMHHKYSILARGPSMYQEIENRVIKKNISFSDLALALIKNLRIPPSRTGIARATLHMWDYVSENGDEKIKSTKSNAIRSLLREIQLRVFKKEIDPLINSTALSELMIWLPNK